MKLSYTLSNRQRKELERGQVLRLALPLDNDVANTVGLDSWARDKLPELSDFIIDVMQEDDVIIESVANPVGSALSTRLGTLTDVRDGRVGWLMPVAIVHVEPQRPVTGKTKLQWPGGDSISTD